MLANKTASWFIAIFISIIIVIIFNYILKKKSIFGEDTRFYIGFIFFLFLIIMFRLNLTIIYVVNDKATFEEYYLFGKIEYKFKTGKKKFVETKTKSCIINDTENKIIVEAINYGSNSNSLNDYYYETISGYSFDIAPDYIDYPLSHAPRMIKSKNSSATKYCFYFKK